VFENFCIDTNIRQKNEETIDKRGEWKTGSTKERASTGSDCGSRWDKRREPVLKTNIALLFMRWADSNIRLSFEKPRADNVVNRDRSWQCQQARVALALRAHSHTLVKRKWRAYATLRKNTRSRSNAWRNANTYLSW